MPMAIGGILLFVAAPFLFGVGISCKRRERNVGYLKGYLVGFLSLFAMFFIETLAMLKLDLSLKTFEWMVVGTLAAMALAGLCLLVIKRPGLAGPSFEARMLYFLVPAVLLFAYSYCYLSPSFANDDTWEFVATSVAKGSVYEYSAMTGKFMENGLPIFNKILAMPLLYVVLADFFGISVNVSAGVLIPALVFVLNLAIVYKIGRELEVSNLPYYMILYFLILMGGTYLPGFGVPATLGYPILREGYSGYAVAYGVVIPAALLLLLKKKYFGAVVTLAMTAPFIRIDRVFFAAMNPIDSASAVNTAGKLIGIYVLAVAAALILRANAKEKIKWQALLIPSVFMAYICEKLKNRLNKKHEIIWYSIGVTVVILASVNFESYKDAQNYFERNAEEAKVFECLTELGDGLVWGPIEFVSVARRLDGNIETLFGRDDNNPYMAGLDYENDEEMALEYRSAIYNVASGRYFYVTYHDTDYMVESAAAEGVKYVVLPTEEGYTVKRMEDIR